MKKFLLVCMFVLAASLYAGAHDVILKLNGESIKALVIEVGPQSLRVT